MSCEEQQICQICTEYKIQFKIGANCKHSICNECYDKISQECNNKCPMCRNVLSITKELENAQKNNTYMCRHCGDEIDESDYIYIIDRWDDIHICAHCYDEFERFYCDNCNKECSYFQLCSHGVGCNNGTFGVGCNCICEFCEEDK